MMITLHQEEHNESVIIDVQQVSFRYPGAEIESLSEVNLQINRGDFVAIIGSNGSGKSTLCKCLNGLIPTYYTGDFTGKVIVNGIDTAQTSIAELSKHVAYVFQDFENQLVRPTVFDELMFAPLNFGYEDYKERALQALHMLDMNDLKQHWIWQLSGGQKHMTALAAALALDPEIIIVDEPVAQLDPAHAKLIYDKLALLNERYGKTIIVIEHHTEFIADYCKSVVLIDRGGKVRWTRPTEQALSSIEELTELHIQPPQVTQAIAAIDNRNEQSILHTRISHAAQLTQVEQSCPIYPVTIEQAVELLQPLLAQHNNMLTSSSYLPNSRQQHMSRSQSSLADQPTSVHEDSMPLQNIEHKASASRKPLVHIQAATSGYQSIDRKKKPTLKEINLSIYPGERIALIGNNGAGKSTLLRLIAGIRKPWSGSVSVCDQNTRAVTPEQLSDVVSFIFQNPEEMFIADNIRADIEFFLKARKKNNGEAFIEHIMETFNLIDLQERDGRLLSGGQQRRATLAIGMAMKPTIMLLDEPTASLDIVSRREMTQLFDELHEQVQAIVVATHDMQLVADWATRVIVMHEGTILMDTTSEEVFQHPHILNKAALIPPQIVQLSHALKLPSPALSVLQFVNQFAEGVNTLSNNDKEAHYGDYQFSAQA